MKILIIGNGGREHALCWKISQSTHVTHIWVANGNAGTATEAKTVNINIEPTDIDGLIHFAKQEAINLVIVGPEAPLAAGISDKMQAANIACLGPSKAAAQLESSKSFCKHFLQNHQIPTARFEIFDDSAKALQYLQQQTFPIVIKADGLAAGKGVIIANDFSQAKQAILAMLCEHQFGPAGSRVVIEEFLTGEELSFICIVDGEQVIPLASSQDHKRRDDGDQGPNTGGMGAYSPAPFLTPELSTIIMEKIMYPTVKALKAMNMPYRGFLYAGLMIDKQGQPKVLEFNCRLGDPETQPILFRLKSDLVELCLAAVHHQLDQAVIVWDPRPALTVVLASGGYPETYRKGDAISGLAHTDLNYCKVFHAGTTLIDHKVLTTGGRVLSVTAIGTTLQDARDNAYRLAEQIRWPDRFYRSDIGYKAL